MAASFLGLLALLFIGRSTALTFSIEEAAVQDIQAAFKSGALTSRALVEYYIDRVAELNPQLHAVIELNPDALQLADEADRQRQQAGGYIGGLYGIPVLVKDNIATADKMNTTAGSFALLGSMVPRDAGIVSKLRKAGAIIFGKANLSEWANIRSTNASNGWSARGGQTKNPYNTSAEVCGSSSGSAVAVSVNMVSVSIGTETDGSIICPSSYNGVAGIKPTVGLTSRAGVVPISHTQDTIGPICRTLSDAVDVLEVIAGFDPLDNQTSSAPQFIPKDGYRQFLNEDGLNKKTLGLFDFEDQSGKLLSILKTAGAVVTENLTLQFADEVFNAASESIVILYELKQDLNKYLRDLLQSPVRSLADVIAFNNEHSDEEAISLYGQDVFIAAEKTTGYDADEYKKAKERCKFLTQQGMDKLFETYKLDALVTTRMSVTSIAAIAGYPAITIPAGFLSDNVPRGLTFIGTKWSEPILIETAFGFEHATGFRRSPPVDVSTAR